MTTDLKTDLARIIWETSRADEGTISATGANIVAAALIPKVEQVVAEVWDAGYIAALFDVGIDQHTDNPYR